MPRKRTDSSGPSGKPRTPRARKPKAADGAPVRTPRPKKTASRSAGKAPVRKRTSRHTLKAEGVARGPRSWELPTRYGETKAVLLARDPYWIYAYWEVTPERLSEARAFLGEEQERSGTVLRVFQSAGLEEGEPRFLYDVEVKPYVTSWYLNVHRPDTAYLVEIVQRAPSGRAFMMARSNAVTTPRDFATPSVEKKWKVPEGIARYFQKETLAQQNGVSSAQTAEGFPFERFPSGKGP